MIEFLNEKICCGYSLEAPFIRVICRHDMKTVCYPSYQDVNWKPPVQGKSHPAQVKEPCGNSTMVT